MAHFAILSGLLAVALVQNPTVTSDPGYGFAYAGCYSDMPPPNKALQGYSFNSTADDPMTAQCCAAYCRNYPFFGLENGNSCTCASEVSSFSTPVTRDSVSQCNLACDGNPNQRVSSR